MTDEPLELPYEEDGYTLSLWLSRQFVERPWLGPVVVGGIALIAVELFRRSRS